MVRRVEAIIYIKGSIKGSVIPLFYCNLIVHFVFEACLTSRNQDGARNVRRIFEMFLKCLNHSLLRY